MEHIKSLYQEAFEKHGDSPSSVLWPKGRQSERFKALTRFINKNEGFKLMDYGCGLAHLKDYLDTIYKNVEYTGVDIVEEFLEHNKKKYPGAHFYTLNSLPESNTYDYIVASGTFNILYTNNVSAHKQQVQDILKKLFNAAKEYLSVNFMTDQVDFQQDGAYHQNVFEIYEFCRQNLSRRIVIDQSYMPFEFTITVWKHDEIKKPDLIY